MSFGGHVNDMVNRVKQNAALKNARKNKFKGGNDYSKVSKEDLESIKDTIKTSTKFERNKRIIYGELISIIAIISILLLNSCGMNTTNELEKWKKEILQTEQQFEKMVQEKGMEKAFLAFADENAVLLRNNNLISGKNNIERYFKTPSKATNIQLNWKPDFIDVSKSGDLAYTYGKYTYSYTDENGYPQESTGIFHTVWKRQNDGNWKFVWD